MGDGVFIHSTNDKAVHLTLLVNKVFMGSGNDYSSFCSELVAKAYARAEIKIIEGKLPGKVTSAHFDKKTDCL